MRGVGLLITVSLPGLMLHTKSTSKYHCCGHDLLNVWENVLVKPQVF